MVLWVQRYNFFVIILQICRNLLNFAANKQEPLRKSCEMKADLMYVICVGARDA